MNPAITRWKTVPSKYRAFVFRPPRGSVHSFDPSASPVKLATVFGASSSNSRAVNVPSLVVKCAYGIDMLSPPVRSYRHRHCGVFIDRSPSLARALAAANGSRLECPLKTMDTRLQFCRNVRRLDEPITRFEKETDMRCG